MFLKLVEQLPSRGFGNSATSSCQKMHNSTLGPSYSFGPRDLEDKQDFLEKLPVWDWKLSEGSQGQVSISNRQRMGQIAIRNRQGWGKGESELQFVECQWCFKPLLSTVYTCVTLFDRHKTYDLIPILSITNWGSRRLKNLAKVRVSSWIEIWTQGPFLYAYSLTSRCSGPAQISITWEVVKNADSQVPPTTSQIKIFI